MKHDHGEIPGDEPKQVKATLEFLLPEHQEEYNRANASLDLCLFIWDFQQYLREQVKYAEEPDDVDTIYKNWFDMLSSRNIDLDKLMT